MMDTVSWLGNSKRETNRISSLGVGPPGWVNSTMKCVANPTGAGGTQVTFLVYFFAFSVNGCRGSPISPEGTTTMNADVIPSIGGGRFHLSITRSSPAVESRPSQYFSVKANRQLPGASDSWRLTFTCPPSVLAARYTSLVPLPVQRRHAAERGPSSAPTPKRETNSSLERVMNLAEKLQQDADSAVSSIHRRSPVFRIRKPFLSKYITRSRDGLMCSRTIASWR